MKLQFAVAAAVMGAVAAMASAATAGNGTGITATPASTVTWAGGTAQFVRSASGIINETNRVNTGDAFPVWLQFRPLTNPTGGVVPNPTCNPNGLVYAPFVWSTTDPALVGTPTSGYFLPGVQYNVCVYIVNPVVATGTIDSSAVNGTDVTLPTGLNGHFRIDVSGTYTNDGNNVADAEYTSTDGWIAYMNGYDISPYFLGEGFGDVQVNGGFVDWGAYSPTHAYSLLGTYSGSINLAVFDGDSNTNTKVPGWYGDNTGSLNYTVTYLGL